MLKCENVNFIDAGISTRDVTCSRIDDNTHAGKSNCPQDSKPALEQVCNPQDCPPEYVLKIYSKPFLCNYIYVELTLFLFSDGIRT